MKIIKIICFSFLFVPVITHLLPAQDVIRQKSSTQKLEQQFELALEKGKSYTNFWIGYSIENGYNNNLCLGSFCINDNFDELGLRDLIENTVKFQKYKKLTDDEIIQKHTHRSINVIHGRISSSKAPDKEIAILFRYENSNIDLYDFTDIYICNLSYYVQLENDPLLWLGTKQSTESFNFAQQLYSGTNFTETKENLLPVIAVHKDLNGVTPLLKNILFSESDEDLLEEIPFWLGYQDNYEAFEILKKVLYSDASEDMKEEAVLGIGQLTFDEATEELIKIAKRNPNIELRQDAILWLGQKAVKKAELALKDFVENDPDIEIKKRAVYALAESSDDHIGYLAELAKSSNSLEIRKCAIYAIGNSDDEKALSVLIELLNY